MHPNDNHTASLRCVLSGIPATDPDYGQWWNGEDGSWLYEEICERIGIPLGISSGLKFGVFYEPQDVANTAVDMLRANNLHPYILAATDPWGYLASMVKRQLNKETGMHLRVELNEEKIRSAYVETPETEVTMEEAVDRTTKALSPLVPREHVPALSEAVWYFAERGHARLSHLYTEASRDPRLAALGLDRNRILAIANAVLGSRPNHGSNSLIAGYLSDDLFDPRASIPHRLALKKFATRFNKYSEATLAA